MRVPINKLSPVFNNLLIETILKYKSDTIDFKQIVESNMDIEYHINFLKGIINGNIDVYELLDEDNFTATSIYGYRIVVRDNNIRIIVYAIEELLGSYLLTYEDNYNILYVTHDGTSIIHTYKNITPTFRLKIQRDNSLTDFTTKISQLGNTYIVTYKYSDGDIIINRYDSNGLFIHGSDHHIVYKNGLLHKITNKDTIITHTYKNGNIIDTTVTKDNVWISSYRYFYDKNNIMFRTSLSTKDKIEPTINFLDIKYSDEHILVKASYIDDDDNHASYTVLDI